MSAASTKRAYRIALFAVAGTLAGLLLFVSPWGRAAEERFGLAWLFTLRGAVRPSGPLVSSLLEN